MLTGLKPPAADGGSHPLVAQENFFDLGGHSALAARMATELSGEYSLPVTVGEPGVRAMVGQFGVEEVVKKWESHA